jgi:hypothetical protein
MHTSVGAVSGGDSRPALSIGNKAPGSELKSVNGQYADPKATGDSSQVSDHYQYCFRGAPYCDSNQQYRETGNGLLYLFSSVTGGSLSPQHGRG